ncbi:hypothetical protein B0H19DRAFT_1074398 [Mycena capillaripes]|nr:hypothetical protein B0H19DRAFT_1074398 [Mycena capillaripes]
MFTGGKSILPCVSFLFALASQTSAYAIPSRSLFARHHTAQVLVCGVPSATDGTMPCGGFTLAGPDAANFTAAEVTDQLRYATQRGGRYELYWCCNGGRKPQARRQALATRHHTEAQIICSSSATVGSSFTCTGTTSLGADAVNATAAETATNVRSTTPAESLVAVV